MKFYKLKIIAYLLFTQCASVHAISSVRSMTVTVKNETPQEFIVKLVNLESSQETLIEVLDAQHNGRDIITISVPPELYGISIYHAPTKKTTSISAKALRTQLAPAATCAQITLKPRIYVGEPQLELSFPSRC